MVQKWRQTLIEAVERDRTTRQMLSDSGALMGGESGINPVMEMVHSDNAGLLDQVFDDIGWPGRDKVGDDGAAAAIVIIQHAVSSPMMLRRAIRLMLPEIPKGNASAMDAAYLSDRIAVYEGRPQLYGTQFDWDDKGQLSPATMDNPKEVDERRKKLGLPNMAETTKRMREGAAKAGEKAPTDLKQRRAAFDGWARHVGWRA